MSSNGFPFVKLASVHFGGWCTFNYAHWLLTLVQFEFANGYCGTREIHLFIRKLRKLKISGRHQKENLKINVLKESNWTCLNRLFH